jgi:putative secretion ATPase (PEP-CTERM system associated)
MMFAEFYGLAGHPFQISPDHRFFYGSKNHKKALAYLTYGLQQGDGFIVIVGDIGAGKSTLVAHLLSQLAPDEYLVSKITSTQIEADDMLRLVAGSFGLPHEGSDKATLLRRLENFFRETQDRGKRLLLIVDEAQNLPDRSLEELRMLSNIQFGERPPLQSFLVGQPQLQRIMSAPGLEQLRQRVIASYHLGPMEAAETVAYIEHRLMLVGWRRDPEFADEAFQLIHRHSGGIPRRINTICTRLLLYGMLEECHRIEPAAVGEIMTELTQEMASTGVVAPAQPFRAADGSLDGLASLCEQIGSLEMAVRSQEKMLKRLLNISLQALERWTIPARAGWGREP